MKLYNENERKILKERLSVNLHSSIINAHNTNVYDWIEKGKISNINYVESILKGRSLQRYLDEELGNPLAYIVANTERMCGLMKEDKDYMELYLINDSKHSDRWNGIRFNMYDGGEGNQTILNKKDINNSHKEISWARCLDNGIKSLYPSDGNAEWMINNTMGYRLNNCTDDIDHMLVVEARSKILQTIRHLEMVVLESKQYNANVALAIGGGYIFNHNVFDDPDSLNKIGRQFVESIINDK